MGLNEKRGNYMTRLIYFGRRKKPIDPSLHQNVFGYKYKNKTKAKEFITKVIHMHDVISVNSLDLGCVRPVLGTE